MSNVRKGEKGEMHAKKSIQVDNQKPTVIDFGKRTISNQNFSKMVALPKQALANLGNNVQRVNVELVNDKDSKFIRLTAASSNGSDL